MIRTFGQSFRPVFERPRRASLRRPAMLLLALLATATLAIPALAGTPSRNARIKAAKLYDHALELLDRNTIDDRRAAIMALEQVTQMIPNDPDYELTLARVYYEAGFIGMARGRFERVVKMAPEDADGRYGLGQVWRRDWLRYVERSSLERAVEHLTTCCRLAPGHTDGWIMLASLLMEQKKLRPAYNAALRGLEANPRRTDALLAVAYTAYNNGDLERADSAFTIAIPRMPRNVRERFDDISPVATERDTFELHRLSDAEQGEFVRRFWKALDPDLATRVNEALLEYRARVAHAYFIYYNPKRREWDERGEVYVRYGHPHSVVYNPVGGLLITRVYDGKTSIGGAFPANFQIWNYPELGMSIRLEDRTLNEYYMLPVTMSHDPDPLPDPSVLTDDHVVPGSMRGVFPRFAPGVVPMPVAGVVAQFESDARPQLLAQVEVDGDPSDSLYLEWVVLDSTTRELKRGTRMLAPSACDPEQRRVADLLQALDPGHYTLGVSVRDRRGRRGLYKTEFALDAVRPRMQLSDIVVSCGAPFVGASGGITSVRPEPNPSARIGPRDPLTAYFEIYRLAADRDGLAHFEYVYTVKSAEKDPRIWLQRAFAPKKVPDPITATRGEEQLGALRRQFVSVPVQSLPAGRYTLEIIVRDLVGHTESRRTADFVKLKTGPG